MAASNERIREVVDRYIALVGSGTADEIVRNCTRSAHDAIYVESHAYFLSLCLRRAAVFLAPLDRRGVGSLSSSSSSSSSSSEAKTS